MNIEVAFIKECEIQKIADIYKQRLAGNCPVEKTAKMELPNSYEAILKDEQKRKIVIFPIDDKWVGVMEAKEVNDYDLLLYISEVCATTVVNVLFADSVAGCGYAVFEQGNVTASEFHEEEYEECEEFIEEVLERYEIDYVLLTFPMIMRDREMEKTIVQ